jgi:hypothetical protein
MAYTINLTDGTVLTTIADGTVNNSSTSMVLIGKNYAGYGTYLNDNLVHILENSSAVTAPSNALQGQLWWDKAGNLKVYTGSIWKTLGAVASGSSSPSGPVTGNGWWDTNNQQFNIWNGSNWVLVGPAFSSNTGTSGTLVGTIIDSNASSHIAVNVYVQNTLVGIYSKDSAYTPASSISGFSTIKPGFNLVSNAVVSGVKLWGTASDSDSVGGVGATVLARTDQATTFSSNITSNTSIIVGTGANIVLGTSGTTAQITSTKSNADLAIRANVGGSLINGILIDGSTGLASVYGPPTANLGIATKAYVDGMVGTGPLQRDGSNSITGAIKPSANATIDFGSSSLRYANIWATTFQGTALQADYADLAERFEADSYYAPGTVLALGGLAEVTIEDQDLSENVFGVVSTRPGYMMNSSAGTNDTHPPIAVSGRVPVRVVGQVKKGDRLVSAGNGLARAGAKTEITPFNVIGRSLENKYDDAEGTVLAIVKLNS